MSDAELSIFWTVLVLSAVFFAILCGAITQSRGHGFLQGFLIGGCLGVLGLIIVLAQKRPQPHVGGVVVPNRECPHCRQQMRADASVCHRCARESRAWSFHHGQWWVQDDEGNWYMLNPTTKQWELLDAER
jgi:hypothetical protein